MMAKREVLDWLATLPDDCSVAVDEGGLGLVQAGTSEDVYIEVGGEPEEEDALRCGECGVVIDNFGDYDSSPCGTFCHDCMEDHMRECEVCRREFGGPADEVEDDESNELKAERS